MQILENLLLIIGWVVGATGIASLIQAHKTHLKNTDRQSGFEKESG